MLVSYNKENDSIEVLLSSIGKLKEVKISDDLKKSLEEIGLASNITTGSIEKLSNDYNITDKSALDFMTDVQNGTFELKEGQSALQGYQSWLQQTGKAAQFANIRAKALSATMKVISSIGWMALISGITWAVGKGIEAIDNAIHKEERYAERLAEMAQKAEEAKSNISSLTDELKQNSDTVNKAKDRYAELAQGVNLLNNKNISLKKFRKCMCTTIYFSLHIYFFQIYAFHI